MQWVKVSSIGAFQCHKMRKLCFFHHQPASIWSISSFRAYENQFSLWRMQQMCVRRYRIVMVVLQVAKQCTHTSFPMSFACENVCILWPNVCDGSCETHDDATHAHFTHDFSSLSSEPERRAFIRFSVANNCTFSIVSHSHRMKWPTKTHPVDGRDQFVASESVTCAVCGHDEERLTLHGWHFRHFTAKKEKVNSKFVFKRLRGQIIHGRDESKCGITDPLFFKCRQTVKLMPDILLAQLSRRKKNETKKEGSVHPVRK